jgi:hypothetical protein
MEIPLGGEDEKRRWGAIKDNVMTRTNFGKKIRRRERNV